MLAKLNQFKQDKPLVFLFVLALMLRVTAAIFAKGFLMFDDHFLLVDIPYAWLQDYDYDHWLPNSLETKPAGFSLLYPAFQYGFFKAMTSLGVQDPQILMLINRLVLALFSTLTVVFSYKIALHFSNKKTAFQVGLLLSILALMPYLSVRNLVEVIGIPFVMWGIWWQVKTVDNSKINRYVFWGAFILGVAFSVRFQNALFLAGIGLYYLLTKAWLKAIYFAIGGGISMILFQLPDWFIFGEFFAEFKAYFAYNDAHKHDFIQGNVFKYLLVLLVACGVPLSFGYLFAFFRYAKKYLILFLPAFLFLGFHSLFPNKQERFILPALPLILTVGVMAWQTFLNESKSGTWFKSKETLFRRLLWTINLPFLLLFTFYYGKQARVNAAEVVAKQNQSINYILIEESDRPVATRIPLFYMEQYPKYFNIRKNKKINSASGLSIAAQQQFDFLIEEQPFNYQIVDSLSPQFIFVVGEESEVENRIEKLKTVYPNMEHLKTTQPSFLDKLFQRNKRNNNRPIHVFENKIN